MPVCSFPSSTILDGCKLAEATKALTEQGIVVIEDAIGLDHIDILREKCTADVELLLNRKDRPFNWNPGNLQQDPPPFPPYLFRDVLVNEAAIAVNRQILGEGMKNGLYSGNTAILSEQRQPVHADCGSLWPNLKHPHPAYAIVVNVPLVDMSPENGSTEMWPGTHLDTSVVIQDGDIKVDPVFLEERRKIEPPIQPTIKAGSVILRDIRMWHAGMPNRTPVPRPMIAMIHFVSWWPTKPLHFPKGTESLFEHPHLQTDALFTNERVDYIQAPGAHEFVEQR